MFYEFHGEMKRMKRIICVAGMSLLCCIIAGRQTDARQETVPVTVEGRPEEDRTALLPQYSYSLADAHEVDGRQGIAWENGLYFVSGSTTLSVYDQDWNQVLFTDTPFTGFQEEVNHIGDIDSPVCLARCNSLTITMDHGNDWALHIR